MHLPPVVVPVVTPVPLDPIALIVYAAVFVAAAIAVSRKASIGTCALLVCAPFAFYRDVGSTTITLEKVVVVATLLGLSTYIGAFGRLGARAIRPLLLVAACAIGATALSATQALHLGPSVREIFKGVEYLTVFAAAYCALRIDPDVTLVERTFAGVVIAVCALALVQELFGAPSGLHFASIDVPRIAGPLEGPNQLGAFLELSIPVLAALIAQRRTFLLSLALGAAVAAEILTFSRAGILFAFVGLAVVVTFCAHRRALVAPVAIGASIGLAVTGAWASVAHSFGVFRLFDWSSNYAGGVGNRGVLWHAALLLWREHPLLGIGAGNFELELPLAGVHGVRTEANSWYLQALVEGGIPSLLTTLALASMPIVLFARRLRSSPLALGACVAGAAFALHGIVDDLMFFTKVGAWWWLVLAIAAAACTDTPHPDMVTTP